MSHNSSILSETSIFTKDKIMPEIVIFRPTEELIRRLFRYHKATRKNIERKELSKELTISIQEQLGYSFRHALVLFGFKMVVLPLRLCAIIEAGKPGFTVQLAKILQKRLGIGSDSEGSKILDKFAEEFKAWLKNTGESLEAEEENWPYKRVYLMDNGNVIMDINHTGVRARSRSIH